MPWGNSWSGAGEVIASQVEVINNNTVVAAINPDGSASFTSISDSGNFYYQGNELTTILDDMPQGIVAIGTFIMPAGTITGSTPQIIGGLTWNATLPNREYRFTVYDVTYSCSSTAVGHGGQIGFTDENNVTEGNFDEYTANVGDGLGHNWTTYCSQSGVLVGAHTLNVTLVPVVSTDTLTTIAHTVTVSVVDEGPLTPNTGFQGSLSGPPPIGPTTHIFQVQSYATASYQGSGHQSAGGGADNGSYMYWGEDPGYSPNGNWRSYCWFQPSTLAAAAGYVSLQKLMVYIYDAWWYDVAGGTLYVGISTYDVIGGVPSTEPGGSTYQLVSANYTARGQALWVDLTNNATAANALKNGTLKGFVLGPGPNSSFAYYGYAYGQDNSTGRPQIYCKYTK